MDWICSTASTAGGYPAHITINSGTDRLYHMNNSTVELPPSRPARGADSSDELEQLKKDLMQAEIRLAKARATIAGAEVDVKVLSSRLRALAK